MQAEDIEKYCELMEQIKARVGIVNHLLTYPHPFPKQHCIEWTYLQYRKILEMIAFGSLVAHQERYSSQYRRFSKAWHAGELFKDLARMNKYFYPLGVTVKVPANPDEDLQIEEKKEGFLSKAEFLELYGKTGGILHQQNPYAKQVDNGWYEKNAKRWLEKIVGLLDTHAIHLYGTKVTYLVRMNATPDGRVGHYILALDEEFPRFT